MEITLTFTSAIAGSCWTLKEVIMFCAYSLELCKTEQLCVLLPIKNSRVLALICPLQSQEGALDPHSQPVT